MLLHLEDPKTRDSTRSPEWRTNWVDYPYQLSRSAILLLQHRGMTEAHQRRAIEWWLYLNSEHPDPARVLAEHQQRSAETPRPALTEPDPGPVLYDTGLNAAEGLWLRSGWAGRG